MRFRVFNRCTGRMHYFDLLDLVSDGIDPDEFSDDMVVMRCLDVTCRSGCLLYEGDVVRYEFGGSSCGVCRYNGDVSCSDCDYHYEGESIGRIEYREGKFHGPTGVSGLFIDIASRVHCIGNIYEDPDLAEKYPSCLVARPPV